ncbi:MAG TPA: BrxA/BrxB family bacilliredoxin [Candidatus Eisenbacteria bacterium]|nr:BrxA/BrxB family bacilliredoxin [Candidatus Eisenbacteria bacterium]
MYPEILIIPMREELTKAGVQELRTAADVDVALADNTGTALVIVNSVCGCAAGKMRPGVRHALQNGTRPDRVYTVFAGQDKEATERARQHFGGFPPSSPSLALFRNGELVQFVPRSEIESRTAEDIAHRLKIVFEQFCGKSVAAGQA